MTFQLVSHELGRSPFSVIIFQSTVSKSSTEKKPPEFERYWMRIECRIDGVLSQALVESF